VTVEHPDKVSNKPHTTIKKGFVNLFCTAIS